MNLLFYKGKRLVYIYQLKKIILSKQYLLRYYKINGINYKYQVHIPIVYNINTNWPVILFLHGANERGMDGERQTIVGLGPPLIKYQHFYKAISIFPQCRKGSWWIDAIVPICGGIYKSNYKKVYSNIELNKPIWIYHGAKDKEISVEESRNIYNHFRSIFMNIKYTEYKNIGHECWDNVYKNKSFIKSLFNQKLI